MLQATWECRYLFEVLILILLDKHSEVGLLDHMAVVFHFLAERHRIWDLCSLTGD